MINYILNLMEEIEKDKPIYDDLNCRYMWESRWNFLKKTLERLNEK